MNTFSSVVEVNLLILTIFQGTIYPRTFLFAKFFIQNIFDHWLVFELGCLYPSVHTVDNFVEFCN